MRKNVTVEELRFLIQHWDSLTISQLAEDMTKLFAREITRTKVYAMAHTLRQKGCKLAVKPKERNSAYNLAVRTKPNAYEMAISETKVIEVKHI